MTPNDVEHDEVHCRICLDDCGKMLMACECAGSVRFVHEECLRTWVMARMAKTPNKSLDKVCAPCYIAAYHVLAQMECEICHAPYKMKVGKELNPRSPDPTTTNQLLTSIPGYRWLNQTLAADQLRFFCVFAFVLNAIAIYRCLPPSVLRQ